MDTEKQPKETFVEQMERVNRTNPFMIHNNIRAVALSEDAAEVCAEVTEDSLNAMQTVHGGLMFVPVPPRQQREEAPRSRKDHEARKNRLLHKIPGDGVGNREGAGRGRVYVLLYG